MTKVLNVYHKPNWLFIRRLGIKVLLAWIKGGMIRITFSHDLGQANDRRFLAIAVIEKHAVTNLDGITHKVSGLVITHSVPVISHVRHLLQIIEGETIRFRLH